MFTVHIGTHKTGTSSVQEAMRQDRSWLSERGVNFLKLPDCYASHNPFAHAIAVADDAGLVQLQTFLAAAARESALHHLLSAEEISVRIDGTKGWDGFDRPDYWDRRLRYLKNARRVLSVLGEPRVLICFRRHDEYATSLYATNILSDRFRWSFPEFLGRCSPVFDYAAQLALIRDVFPDTEVQNFDDLRRDLIPSFCTWAQIPRLPISELVSKVTPDPSVIVWLQRFLATSPSQRLAWAARGFALSANCSALFSGHQRTSLWPNEAALSAFLATCSTPSAWAFAPPPAIIPNPVCEADLAKVQMAFWRWRRQWPLRAMRRGMTRLTRRVTRIGEVSGW